MVQQAVPDGPLDARVVLVTGGRDYANMDAVARALSSFPLLEVVIEGGAKGADRLCRLWAQRNGIHVATVEALWDYYGRPAGHLRNQAMAYIRPDVLLAFPGGRGTASMVRIAEQQGIPIVYAEET